MIDIFGGFGHIDLLTICRIISEEVGQRSAVIEMRVRDEYHGEFLWIDMAKERQAVSIFLVDHEAAIQHDLLVVDGEYETGATHFAPCSQRQN